MAIGRIGQHPPRIPRRRSGEFPIPGGACGGRQCPMLGMASLTVVPKYLFLIQLANRIDKNSKLDFNTLNKGRRDPDDAVHVC